MENTWTLEEAKKNFDAIARAAFTGEPQYIKTASRQDLVLTARGTDENTEQFRQEENRRFVEFLLSIPKGPSFLDKEDKREITTRDIEF